MARHIIFFLEDLLGETLNASLARVKDLIASTRDVISAWACCFVFGYEALRGGRIGVDAAHLCAVEAFHQCAESLADGQGRHALV